MEFQTRPGDLEAAAQQINNSFSRWFRLFKQYVTLLAPQDVRHVQAVGDGTGPIEVFIDDGHQLRRITLDKLKEACHLSSSGLSPRLEYRLMLEAYAARCDSDYRKAIIEAGTALEISLTNRALEEFRTRKMSAKPLLEKFRTLNGRFKLLRRYQFHFPRRIT